MRRWRLYRPAEPGRGWLTAAVLFLVYAALLYFGVAWGRDSLRDSVFWPANGVVVAALLVLPRRIAVTFALACLALNFGANLAAGLVLVRNVVYSCLNLGLAAGVAILTRTFCGAATDLSRLKRLAHFTLIAFAAAGAEATVGSALKALLWNGSVDIHGWWTWILCDALGLVITTPAVLLALKSHRAIYSTPAGRTEKLALLGGVILLTLLGFAQAQTPVALLLYPLLVLIAFRAGAPWVSVSVMALALPAIAMTVRGYGPIALFAPPGPFHNEELLQIFLCSVFVCALPATNALGERNRTAARLLRSHAAARAARLRAEEAVQAKSRFLAVMSHEIRTPLNGVIGFSNVLAQRADLAPDARRQVDLVLGSSNILLALVNDILDFSKIEARKFELNTSPVAMDDVLDEVAAITRPGAQAKGLALTIDSALEPGLCYAADDLRLKQVLLNLINNAVKFTARGSVHVSVACEGICEAGRHALMFRVTDTGIGISQEQEERLFKPFSQADATITRSYGGTGLGLAISKSLVEMMDGEIGVERIPEGGSAFWFRVRLDPASAQAAAAGGAGLPEGERALRVLVVDDHPVNREVACLFLAAAGCETSTCENGVAAVDAAERQAFDLILMDVHMPEMDGYAASRAIRRLPGAAGQTPIIAMTAAASSEDVAMCKAAGMNGHVAKPINHKALMATICTTLGLDAAESVAAA